jgi:hypothetical protein
MSHLRRAIALLILALVGWLTLFGAGGVVVTSASGMADTSLERPFIACC